MVKIEGLEPFRRSLKRYGEEFPEISKKIIKQETFKLQALAKKDAPVDTGKLRQSINVEPFEDDGLTGKVSAGGAIAPYAPYIEFGTGGKVGIPKGWEEVAAKFKGTTGRKISMKPQPYLIPNFTKVRYSLTDKFRAEIRKLGK